MATYEPEAVEVSHADWGMVKTSGVELKGRTVRVSGRAVGRVPPANEILKGPHCCIGEYEMRWKTERTARGEKARKYTRPRRGKSMGGGVEERNQG